MLNDQPVNQNERLPQSLLTKLHQENTAQRLRLAHKAEVLCKHSPWSRVHKQSIVTNLSNHRLTQYEEEALTFGLKFTTGYDESRQDLLSYIVRNYRHNQSLIEKGFTQGVIACAIDIARDTAPSLPNRHMEALKNLGKNTDIHITKADKGGGVVILNQTDYLAKMHTLLADDSTYDHVKTGTGKKLATIFNQTARRILSRTESGKKYLWLLEENPNPPHMYGLPKIHKEGHPMRPITSGIGSAPHKVAKFLAKPLSGLLGTISKAHLRHSQDLLQRINGISIRNKRMASFDVASLFTNVPVDKALIVLEKAIASKEVTLPMEDTAFLALVKLCVQFNCFSFNQEEYQQKFGMPMGSPLSTVLACLYMESLEEGQISKITGKNIVWLRYIDDVLILAPRRTNLHALLNKINNIEPTITFTMEDEHDDGTLPFLDVLLVRRNNDMMFKVYRKPTHKNDLIHYLSAHDPKTKSGVIIGFFIRAFRICSREFLAEELQFITDSFRLLMYPHHFISRARKKAAKIAKGKGQKTQSGSNFSAKIIVPAPISQRNQSLHTLPIPGRKIGDLIKRRKQDRTDENQRIPCHKQPAVYKIPCHDCDKAYYGETYRGFKTREEEHKRAWRNYDERSALVIHTLKTGHSPDWNNATIVKIERDPNRRKAVEAACIARQENCNQNGGKYILARHICDSILASYAKIHGNTFSNSTVNLQAP